MNDPSTHANDAAMTSRQQTQNRPQTQAGLVFVVIAVATLFLTEYLTPPYDVISMGLSSAAIMTVFLYLYPEPFRSRGGSLVPAWCLVAALWMLTVVSTVVSLIG